MQAVARWAFRVSALVVAVLATVQPALGAFAYFRPSESVELDTLHLVAGGILYNFVLAMAVAAAFTGLRLRWWLLGLSGAQYGLVHGQLLLGLESRDDPTLLAYHVPLGVLIVLVAWVTAAIGFGARPGWREVEARPDTRL